MHNKAYFDSGTHLQHAKCLYKKLLACSKMVRDYHSRHTINREHTSTEMSGIIKFCWQKRHSTQTTAFTSLMLPHPTRNKNSRISTSTHLTAFKKEGINRTHVRLQSCQLQNKPRCATIFEPKTFLCAKGHSQASEVRVYTQTSKSTQLDKRCVYLSRKLRNLSSQLIAKAHKTLFRECSFS